MSLIKQRLNALEIDFQTLLLPPPFSHTYRITAALAGDELGIHFEIHYTEREQLSKEEILEEGFTPEDDYRWEGTLPKAWTFAMLEQLRKSNKLFEVPKSHAQQLLSLNIRYENGEQLSGIPNNQETWEYFAQEMIQAIYEISKKEMPLEILYQEINDQAKLQISIQPSFSQRKVRIHSQQQGKLYKQEHEWARLKPLLETVYLPDYQAELASTEEPRKPGSYISPGDGLWYELGKAVTNPGEKKDAVGALKERIRALTGE